MFCRRCPPATLTEEFWTRGEKSSEHTWAGSTSVLGNFPKLSFPKNAVPGRFKRAPRTKPKVPFTES